MKCKNCNTELQEGAVYCPECGAKVNNDVPSTPLKCRNCGADLTPGAKFCDQCGAATAQPAEQPIEQQAETAQSTEMAQNADTAQPNGTTAQPSNAVQPTETVQNADTAQPNGTTYAFSEQAGDIVAKTKSKIMQKPKFFGALGIVALILIVASTISLNLPKNTATGPKAASSSASSRSSSSKSGSSSSAVLTEDLKKLLVQSALIKEVRAEFPLADPQSTKYVINKTEKDGDETIVYGRVYLYDKYGKTTKGRSGSSGSYSKTFEVTIDNDTRKVESCDID